MPETLTQTFEYVLAHHHEENNMFADIYSRLFVKLLSEKECEELLQAWMLEYEKGNKYWFAEFHKSIRQCDFYGNEASYYKEYSPDDRISEKEIKERKDLLYFFQSNRKKETTSSDEIDPVRAKRLRELNTKFHKTEKKSIAGHLDMILHSLIHSDNGFLNKVMETTFEDYRHYKNKEIKGLI